MFKDIRPHEAFIIFILLAVAFFLMLSIFGSISLIDMTIYP